ncbi:hypothetical protein D3C81_1835180 [compost metagenome]
MGKQGRYRRTVQHFISQAGSVLQIQDRLEKRRQRLVADDLLQGVEPSGRQPILAGGVIKIGHVMIQTAIHLGRRERRFHVGFIL